jgi:hypothetical protein
MIKPYSDAQLTDEVVEQELCDERPNDEMYAHRLSEMVDELSDYAKFETIARLKIDEMTRPLEIIKFGELCAAQKANQDCQFKIEFGTGLAFERLKSYTDRVNEVVTSEVYRRRDVNRKWEAEQKAKALNVEK